MSSDEFKNGVSLAKFEEIKPFVDTQMNVSMIVCAVVGKLSVRVDEIPKLITDCMNAFQRGAQLPLAEQIQEYVKATPAEIKKSITPSALISFVDGKPYKTLRRHLTTQGLTPEEYRARFGLPADYPLVSADYSEARSNLAKSLGLGQQRRKTKPGGKPSSGPQHVPDVA